MDPPGGGVCSPEELSKLMSFLYSKKEELRDTLRNIRGDLQKCTTDDLICAADLVADVEGLEAGTRFSSKRMRRNAGYIPRMERLLRELKTGGGPPPAPREPPPVGFLAHSIQGDADAVRGVLTDLSEETVKKGLKDENILTGPFQSSPPGGDTYYHQTVRGPEGVHDSREGADVVTFFYVKRGARYYVVAWGVHNGEGSASYTVRQAVAGSGLQSGSRVYPE